MKEKIKNRSISWIVLSILYILLGISLAVWPTFLMNIFCYALGILLLSYGSFAIYNFFREKEHKISSLLNLFLGIISGALGIIMFFYPEVVQSAAFVIFGLYIIVDSVLNIVRVFRFRQTTYAKWKIHLFLSVIAILLGILVACYPLLAEGTVFRILGFILIYVGGTDLWTLIQFSYVTSSEYCLPDHIEKNP
ncbi:MAG: HdeD family acid-resistance protein [Massiliimalia sp.]|jgi:uncharacterized membrane protein HdeD (DUF308 family)